MSVNNSPRKTNYLKKVGKRTRMSINPRTKNSRMWFRSESESSQPLAPIDDCRVGTRFVHIDVRDSAKCSSEGERRSTNSSQKTISVKGNLEKFGTRNNTKTFADVFSRSEPNQNFWSDSESGDSDANQVCPPESERKRSRKITSVKGNLSKVGTKNNPKLFAVFSRMTGKSEPNLSFSSSDSESETCPPASASMGNRRVDATLKHNNVFCLDSETECKECPTESEKRGPTNSSQTSIREYFRSAIKPITDDRPGFESLSKMHADLNRMSKELARYPCKNRILHDICPFRGQPNDILRRLEKSNERATCNVLVIAAHTTANTENSQLHIIHDCTFTVSRCQCAIVQQFKPLSRRNSPPVFARDFSAEDWYSLFISLTSPGRKIIYSKIPGHIGYSIPGNGDMERLGYAQRGPAGQVGTCEDDAENLSQKRALDECHEQAYKRMKKDPSSSTYVEVLYKKMKGIPCCPPRNVLNTQ